MLWIKLVSWYSSTKINLKFLEYNSVIAVFFSNIFTQCKIKSLKSHVFKLINLDWYILYIFRKPFSKMFFFLITTSSGYHPLFFQLSIIERIYLGDIFFVSIFSDLQIFLINLIWSSWSIIVKLAFNPTACACFLNSLAQIEWKVPSHESPIAFFF